ncbi:hypothetical protein R3P38DRAFT_2572883 [Favolaschia claudopus]|uniref:Transposase n=1 Tax=Favolaschia claudopus TaxID=2862362 RepID=A0AAV9ZQJ0_9AGAR
MPFRHIFKVRALWLLDNGYVTEEVSDLLGVSTRSIARWRHNVANYSYGSVIPPRDPMQGRPRILNALQTDSVLELVEQFPELYYLDEIMDWIAITHDIGISRSAVQELISDIGITSDHVGLAGCIAGSEGLLLLAGRGSCEGNIY